VEWNPRPESEREATRRTTEREARIDNQISVYLYEK